MNRKTELIYGETDLAEEKALTAMASEVHSILEHLQCSAFNVTDDAIERCTENGGSFVAMVGDQWLVMPLCNWHTRLMEGLQRTVRHLGDEVREIVSGDE